LPNVFADSEDAETTGGRELMRVLCIEPGPAFSVADVHRGWCKAFTQLGCQVLNFNLADRLDFYTQAHIERHGRFVRAFNDEGALRLAAKGIQAAVLEVWPDLVMVTSGFFIPPAIYELVRERGFKVVLNHLESPYEDSRQMTRAAYVDANIINDPTHLESFRAVNPKTWYLPAAHDPDVHHAGPGHPDLACDFAFVGTGFDSRIRFFEAVDWEGIDVALAGNWKETDAGSPLRKFVVHDLDECFPNDRAAALYRSARASANLYRKEALRPGLERGWAIGPREIELAACGTFFLREPRPEGDGLFPMLPTFVDPDEFGEQLGWWLDHDLARDEAALAARAAVADRTFVNNAKQLLRLLDT
jgi:spore maturation protein CgeB